MDFPGPRKEISIDIQQCPLSFSRDSPFNKVYETLVAGTKDLMSSETSDFVQQLGTNRPGIRNLSLCTTGPDLSLNAAGHTVQ